MINPTYTVTVDELTGLKTIHRIDTDGKVWAIPEDETNSDYQRYLNPEAEQSTPILPE
jgi:hypothetical protein